MKSRVILFFAVILLSLKPANTVKRKMGEFSITVMLWCPICDYETIFLGFQRNEPPTTAAPRDVNKTTKPPCCRDMLGSMTCQRLQKINEQNFGKRCNKDAEFRLVFCFSYILKNNIFWETAGL